MALSASLNPPTEDKPLPDEPLSKLIHALSSDHKKHFVGIITSCVESEDLPGSWVRSIEYAVNQMAMAISYEDWLIGLKHAHARRIQVEQKRVQTRRDAWKRERDKDKDKEREKEKEKEKPKAKKAEVKHEPKKPEREHSEAYSFATETVVKAVADLRNRIKNRSPSTTQDKSTPCHLLLSLRVTTSQSHHQSSIFSSFDSKITRFDANLNFQSSYFSLPDNLADEEDVTVLFGLNEWKEEVISELDPRLVGGSFLIKSTTPRIYHAVANCLRVAIYCRLAMILEQFLFHDLGYKLQFPSPASISNAQGSSFRRVSSLRGRDELASKSPPIPPIKLDSSSSLRRQLWLFVADKAEKLDKFLNRNSLVGQAPDTDSGSDYFPRSASLDLPFTTRGSNEFDKREIVSRDRTPVPEAIRSLSGESSTGSQTTKEREGLPPFTHILSRLGDSLPLLSTSPAVLFETPRLLKNLSEREETDRNRRLRGDERIALDTILGWEGRETRGRGMTGITGFVRHQQITVLFTATVPAPPISVEKGQKNAIITIGRVPCQKAQRTFRYFSDDAKEDITLGGLVEMLCGSANERCDKRFECDHSVGQHEFEWIHAGVKVHAKLSPHPFTEEIVMWRGCVICDRTSSKLNMSEATCLISFGKFIELVVYDRQLQTSSSKLCDHADEKPHRLSHNFAYHDWALTLSRSKTSAVMDIQVPWLQINKAERNAKANSWSLAEQDLFQCGPVGSKEHSTDDVALLTRQITDWFGALTNHLTKVSDTLELFQSDILFGASMPSCPESGPPSWDSEAADENTATPKPGFANLPPSEESLITKDSLSIHSDSEATSSQPSDTGGALVKLEKLKDQIQHRQQELLQLLQLNPLTHLNDIRRKFKSEASHLKRMTEGWLCKYFKPLNLASGQHLMQINLQTPDWWDSKCHAVPGSRFVVKDGDWGTIIASTLGSADYCKELAAIIINNSRHGSLGKAPIPLPTVPQSDSGSSAASSTSRGSTPTPSVMASVVSLSALDLHGLPLQGLPPSHSQYSPSEMTLDSDQDYASSPEQYTTSVSRRDHPRDLSSALSLLSSPLWSTDSSKRSTQDPLTTYSRFSSISEAATRLINPRSVSVSSTANPPVSALARAKAAVELSATIAGGESTRGTSTDLTDRLMAQAHSGTNTPRSSPVKSTPVGSPADDGLVIPGSSFQSIISRSDNTTLSSLVGTILDAQVPHSAPPSPSLESPPWPVPRKDSDGLPFKPSETSPKTGRHIDDQLHVPKKSAEVGGLSPSKRHALLAANESHLPHIDPKPHIKYEWTVGTRLKFGCTVYYAQQFDSLRNRCGVGESFSQSLAATQNWAAEGGKSKSNFWKTQDNRFIIKTLVNSWNVADLQVLIDIAPAYFRYMEHCSSHASVLAKLMGFFTVEMSNLVTGDRTVANLLVMENLFFNHHITRTFDLKGIVGRRVKVNDKVEAITKTLFDSEWVEGQKINPTLINASSNAVLLHAIRADAEFLAKNLIMDYSLLLGLDEERQQLVCGLVDTIGSFSLAKNLEWRLKQGINSGLNSGAKETTVLPPQDYHERFVKAIESYFLACPDKWTKPLGNQNAYSAEDLPCVL